MLIQKINNSIKGIMNMEITDQMQKILENTFDKIKDVDNWKNPTMPEYLHFTFNNYELLIQKIGLIALAYTHFHGGYELSRVGVSDKIEIYSRGYHHYMEN